jgi:serine/threonine-protein kinase
MVLLYVPAGEFRMGFQGGNNELDEKPVHTVNLDAYWIDQTEVTNGMYAECVDVGKCDPPGSVGLDYYLNPEYQNYPVTSVLWEKAQSYCTWAGRRLSTEAEWEKAARGLDQRVYPWKGNKIDCSYANYYDGQKYCFNRVGGPSPVKNYESGKSPYGAYDMGGNVWEWVADFYLGTYYSISPTLNPPGPDTGKLHVARGGAWDVLAFQVRSSNRGSFDSRITIGFRCASDE